MSEINAFLSNLVRDLDLSHATILTIESCLWHCHPLPQNISPRPNCMRENSSCSRIHKDQLLESLPRWFDETHQFMQTMHLESNDPVHRSVSRLAFTVSHWLFHVILRPPWSSIIWKPTFSLNLNRNCVIEYNQAVRYSTIRYFIISSQGV